MTRAKRLAAVAACVVAAAAVETTARAAEPRPLLAFPGAAGPGADATGGRGGEVYHVTRLDDDPNQPGTLRHALREVPPQGRTVVFEVAGVIRLQPPGRAGWLSSDQSNLTIAGQTAPSPGITIVGQTTKLTGRNVILRHLKFRPGPDQLRPKQATNDGLTLYLKDSIVANVSATWADDEAISATDDARNLTVQECLMAEGLNYKGHSYGCIIASEHDDAPIAYHHNLFAHNKSRLPRLGSEKGTGVVLAFTNNVIYDWQGKAGYSANDVDTGTPQPSRSNFLGNYFIAGPSNRPGDVAFHGANDQTLIHQRGNLLDDNRNGTFDGHDRGWALFEGTITRADRAFEVAGPVPQRAEAALERVLERAGAFWWDRDPIDARIVEQVRTQRGRMINDLSDVGGLPQVEPVRRPADFDTDRDGMADAWERARGLVVGTADHNGDDDRDGYTNLEEYLHELARDE